MLFGKTLCAICGEKYPGRDMFRLRDGSICPSCQRKLSPLYPIGTTSSVSDVQAHLAARQERERLAAAFSPEEAVGPERKLLIDRHSGLYAFADETEVREHRFDVFRLSELREAELNVIEREIRIPGLRSDDSREYDFDLEIRQDSSYLPAFSVRINAFPIVSHKHLIRKSYIQEVYRGEKTWTSSLATTLFGGDRRAAEDYLLYYTVGQQMIDALKKGK